MTSERRTPFRLLLAASLAALALAATPAAADMFEDWDADASGGLTSEEFNSGLSESGAYDEWDADEDGLLDDDEIGDLGVAEDDWDLNGDDYLDEDEVGTGYYDAYDANDDDLLDTDEWELFEEDADEEGWFDA